MPLIVAGFCGEAVDLGSQETGQEPLFISTSKVALAFWTSFDDDSSGVTVRSGVCSVLEDR